MIQSEKSLTPEERFGARVRKAQRHAPTATTDALYSRNPHAAEGISPLVGNEFFALINDYYPPQETTENVFLTQWFERNYRYFPVFDLGLDSVKTGEKTNFMLSFNPKYKCPLQSPIDSISIRANTFLSSSRIRKVDPKTGDFAVNLKDNPDDSFINAQILLQLLIATGAFFERERWKEVFQYADTPAIKDFFAHLYLLYEFARNNLFGIYPVSLFDPDLKDYFDRAQFQTK